ncbi:MAG: hypothetical protein ACE5J5_07610 [Candidatus Hydrothermarchaeales archaeon]
MKCKECGANLPYGAFGHIKCEYCNTPNYIPIPEEKREAFEHQQKLIAKGTFRTSFPRMHCRFNVGENEVTLHTGWTAAIIVKVDGKKLKSLRPLLGGKKEWFFQIGEREKNYIKLVVDIPKLFPGIKKWKYEVYVT